MDGWNGHICKDPASNTYCVGCHSYPGEMIRERRDLAWEQTNAGKAVADLDTPPPCMYSVNAFGAKSLTVFSDPPDFFPTGGASRRTWEIPPATVCIWPYEEMYGEKVQQGGRFDNDERFTRAEAYFRQVERDTSLIFYYANYSNPFSEDEEPRYALVGISRVKFLGETEYYEGLSAEAKEQFGGGFIWQRSVTSHYPDQGFCIPYHRYQHDPDLKARLLFTPDNPRNFKYGTRAFSDDEALNLVERFLEVCGTLQEIGDDSQNWAARVEWLQSLIAELWQSRGLYPGLANILDYLGFSEAIHQCKGQTAAGREQAYKDGIFGFLRGESDDPCGLALTTERTVRLRRQWNLKEDDERALLSDCLPRFGLVKPQIEAIFSKKPEEHGLTASRADIAANPYILSEQFVGDGPDDILPFYRIDHGMFPAPDLGQPFLAEKDDWRRLRALCADRLRRETRHTFLPAEQVIHDINHRLSFLPEWKRYQFTENYLRVDAAHLEEFLTIRETNGRRYLYLKSVFEAERAIETQMRALANRPNIGLKAAVTEADWKNFLYDPASGLAVRNPDEYDAAIQGQIAVCQRVFVRPVSVLSGAAGTGKSTVIKSLIQAIERAHGAGTPFCLLAPTGKAADRIRSVTGKPALTIHSFLAQKRWLNPNMSFKKAGGQRESGFNTYIIDETSMLDLELMATLFRAINWTTVQRLILVGDQSQLPPIGRGRVFADVMDWLEGQSTAGVAVLKTNFRQMSNRLGGKGEGILKLASLYERTSQAAVKDEGAEARVEDMLRRIQAGGDVDKDLRICFWNGADDLGNQLIRQIVADMEKDTGQALDPAAPYKLWSAAFGETNSADYQQVLSPYRGEEFGTEHLNLLMQEYFNGNSFKCNGNIDGITLFDKVIQIRNRASSRPLPAYNAQTRGFKWVERFNGEIGFVKAHGFDGQKWKWPAFRISHFQVVFARKQAEWVGYGKKLGQDDSRHWLKDEKVADNLELAYGISCHKAQGSEFERVYFVVPKHKTALLSREMFYTGLTRASRHCTLLVEEDMAPLLRMYRPESSSLLRINSSLFDFRPVPDALLDWRDWYAEGRIHQTLANVMVRSKSEVIIANILAEREIPFLYEVPLTAADGTFYLPDFTVIWNGEPYYWEHLGLLDQEQYRNHWATKKAWYEKHFAGRLVTTEEGPSLSQRADEIIRRLFSNDPASAAPTLAAPTLAAPIPAAPDETLPSDGVSIRAALETGIALPQAAFGTRLAAALASADIPVTITESFQACTNDDDVMDRLLTMPEEWQDAVLAVATNGITASSAGGIRP